MTTEEMLLKRYGVLLSLKDCSELLNRSVEGLRVTLNTDNELAARLRPAKVKLGRRVMFKATELAKFLDEAQ
ncbi:DNA-binding protein [Burkholderia sp. AW49-1]